MKLTASFVLVLLAGAAHAVPLQFDVFARNNSVVGGAPLDTEISFTAGDPLIVSADPLDLWNAGRLPRWSNADGLVVDLFATGSDESGESAGTLIGANFGLTTINDLEAPFGALVGQIDGISFLLGTNFNGLAPASGNLFLAFHDANFEDNTEKVTVTLIPEPPTFALFSLGVLGLTTLRRRWITGVL